MFGGFLVHCRRRGPGRVCCVREMSMTISIRRGKGRSLDAYCTAHWLRSINNKTTQWEAQLLVHSRSITNQLCFPVCGWNIYSAHLAVPPIKDLCLYAPHRLFLCVNPKHWPQGDGESMQTQISSSPPPPIPLFIYPHSLFTISPISACSVVAVSLCVGEACMCILTRAVLRFPPVPT